MMDFKHNLKLLLSREEIEKGISKLADKINKKYGKEQVSLVAVMNGSVLFFADFVRKLDMPIKMDTITVSSYSGTESTRELKFSKKITKPIIEGQHVLIIEDIIDTGQTLTEVYKYLLDLKPKSLEILTLADKKENHPDFPYEYDSIFQVPNKFVVGYGFEIDDLYRQLDQVYTVED